MAIYLIGSNPLSNVNITPPENATPEMLQQLEEYIFKLKSEIPGGIVSFTVKTWRTIGGYVKLYIKTSTEMADSDVKFSEDEILQLHNAFDMEDGAKLSPELCEKLSDVIDEFLTFTTLLGYDKFYYNLGIWETANDNFKYVNSDTRNDLNELVPIESIVYSAIQFDNDEYVPSYSCTRDNLEVFANFLNNCKGFEIQ
jgi:hypothetical protein